MNALIFIVQTLLSLVLFVFMLRVLLQLARADFRNPLAQAVVKITNPLILPLRRVLPPIGKIDTASIVAVLIVASIEVFIVTTLTREYVPNLARWGLLIVLEIVRSLLSVYFYAILLYAVLSMIAPGGYSPVQSLLAQLSEPVLRPFRRIIPPIANLDFSPLWALIAHPGNPDPAALTDQSWCSVQGPDLVLRLRVRPRASPEGFSGVRAGRLQVRVSAAPVDGEANERLMRILARELSLPVAALVLTRGLTSRDKDVLVRAAASRHAQLIARFISHES